MIKVTVTINYLGKNYVTNVLADKEMNEDMIKKTALDQVKRQWSY